MCRKQSYAILMNKIELYLIKIKKKEAIFPYFLFIQESLKKTLALHVNRSSYLYIFPILHGQ